MGLFNMFIGFQCSIASQVWAEDDFQHKKKFLVVNMLRLLAAYDQEGDGCVDSTELGTMLGDPELHGVLEKFGTKVENVRHAADILFQEMDAIPYDELLDVIVDLRESDQARVAHILGIRQHITGHLERLESCLGVGAHRTLTDQLTAM